MTDAPSDSRDQVKPQKLWIIGLRVLFGLGFAAKALFLVLWSHYGAPVGASGTLYLVVVSLVVWRLLFADATRRYVQLMSATVCVCGLLWLGLNIRHTYTGESILRYFTLSFQTYSWKAEGCDPSSAACKMDGICGFEAAQCVHTKEGCAQSLQCENTGECGFKNGQCVATAEGCTHSIGACQASGNCGFKNGQCVATAAGCSASTWACQNLGKCGFKDGACAPTKDGCSASGFCRKTGSCGFKDGHCITTAAGCTNSLFCAQSGKCRLNDGECVQ